MVGGILAAIAWAILIAEFGLTINMIFWQRDNDYSLNEIFLTPEEMETEFSLGDYNSGHFIFGVDTRDMDDFDMLNNPYVEVGTVAYHSTYGLVENYPMEYCPEEYYDKIMEPHLRAFYFQNLCFKDRNKVKLRSNIWNSF